jgi:hypothetical protein
LFFLSQPDRTLFDDILHLLSRPEIYGLLFAFVGGALSRSWRKAKRARKGKTGNFWPTVAATVDLATVAKRMDGEKKPFWLVTLSYFYRQPELQMGEYEREFQVESEARQWASQFKGRLVTVHVNPANNSDSVLLDGDLEGMTAPTSIVPESSGEEKQTPILPPNSLYACTAAQLLSIIGLAISSVLLVVSLASGGKVQSVGAMWAGGVVLGMAVLATIFTIAGFSRSGSKESFWRSYRNWCPAWMRWCVEGAGAGICTFWVLDAFRSELPGVLRHGTPAFGPSLALLAAFWCFLGLTAFHAALLRSQEEVRNSGF